MRPLVIKRKRCFFLVASLLVCISLTLSWIVMHDKISNGLSNGNQLPVFENQMTRVHPKFNVLKEPPVVQTITNEPNDQSSNQSSSYVSRTKASTGHKSVDVFQIQHPEIGSNQNVLQIKEDKINYKNSTFLNKTSDLELVKNKTFAHLGVLGKGENTVLPKVIFSQLKWNLSVSFEDIGNIMKDTAFFNKLRPLDLSGPFLQSSRNRTANFSFSMPINMGYCDCWELHCFCCAQLVNKQLHLNTKSCSNFTFISKSHELDLTFSTDGNFVHRQLISADSPPLLCMGSIPAVADMCVHFSNMTYRVDRMSMHKSQLLGCVDFSFNIYNKTINAFPVDCFQIPGDPNHHPKHEQILLPNFVP